MEQNILSEGQLLDAKGNLNEAGFAYSLVKQYQRDKIKASKQKIRKKMQKIHIIEQKLSRLNNKLLEYEGSNSYTDDNIKISGNYSATYRMKLSPIQEEI